MAQLSDVHQTCSAVSMLAFPYPSLQRTCHSAFLLIAPGPFLSEDGIASHSTPSPALCGKGHKPPESAVPRLGSVVSFLGGL